MVAVAWRNSGGLWLPIDEAAAQAGKSEVATLEGQAAAQQPSVPVMAAGGRDAFFPIAEPSAVIDAWLATGSTGNARSFLRSTATAAAGATGTIKLVLPPSGASGIVRPLDAPGLPALVISLNDYSALGSVTLTVQLAGHATALLDAIPFTAEVDLPAALLPAWMTQSITFTVVNGGTGSVTMTADLRCAVVTANVQSVLRRYYDAATTRLQTVGD